MNRKIIVELDNNNNVYTLDGIYIGIYNSTNIIEENISNNQNNVQLKEVIELVKEVKK